MRIRLLSLLAFLLTACTSFELNQQEIDLINELGFDQELMASFKATARGSLYGLPDVDPATAGIIETEYRGIRAQLSEVDVLATVKQLKPSFKEKGYLVFGFGEGNGEPELAVMKGTDEWDILRYRATHGDDPGQDTEALLGHLKKLDEQFGVTIVSCGHDWLEFGLERLPEDWPAFLNELEGFCPGTVFESENLNNNFIENIQYDKSCFLAW